MLPDASRASAGCCASKPWPNCSSAWARRQGKSKAASRWSAARCGAAFAAPCSSGDWQLDSTSRSRSVVPLRERSSTLLLDVREERSDLLVVQAQVGHADVLVLREERRSDPIAFR